MSQYLTCMDQQAYLQAKAALSPEVRSLLDQVRCIADVSDPIRGQLITAALQRALNEFVTARGEQHHSRFRVATRTLQGLAGGVIGVAVAMSPPVCALVGKKQDAAGR